MPRKQLKDFKVNQDFCILFAVVASPMNSTSAPCQIIVQ